MLNKAKRIIAWCFATLPRKIISSLVIAGILLSSLWFLFFKPAPVEAGWWDEDWLYRRVVTVTNNTTAETDVYVEITSIDTSDAGKVQADCGDLRFTKKDGTQLDYYIVSGCGGASTIVHVKLDMLQTGDQTVYFYYGNPSADNGFIGTDFSTVASDYSIGAIGDEEIGLGPVLWLKFDEGYGAFAYNSTENDAGKLPGTQLDTSHPLADGLVGLWLMNEGSGTTVADLSGNGNTGTLTGGISWVSGIFGPALEWAAGSTQYINIGSPNWNMNNVTMVAWILAGSRTNDPYFLGSKDASNNVFAWRQRFSQTRPQFVYGNGTDVGYAGDSGTYNPPADEWVQIAWTKTAGSFVFYVNGAQNDTDSAGTHNAVTAIDVYIGALNLKGSASGSFRGGTLDHLLIYDRMLSATEIAQLYREPFAMISDTGASRITGGASWTDSGKFDKALDFDGSDGVVTVIRDANVDLKDKDAYSISTWIYPHFDGENGVGEIINKGTDTYIRVDSDGADGYLDLEAKLDLDPGDPTLTIENAVRVNRWSHILLVWEDDDEDVDDEFTIYVNGINMGTSSGGSGVPANDSGNDLLIGGSTGAHFDGIIDEVKIYPYARSPVQVKRSYNQGAAARIGRDDSWLTDGLVGYWKMDESSWTGVADEVEDSSGAGNHGIAVDDATTDTGKFGKGGIFDGTDDYVVIGDTGETEIKTVSLWVKPDAVDVIEEPLDLNGDAYVKITDGTVTGHGFTSPTVYVNGVAGASTVTTSWNLITITTSAGINASALDIGRLSAVYFDGRIDDVRIYNRELSGFEVRRLYDWGPPPVAHWTFDEGSGTSANDSSENANTGTLEGDTAWKGSAECKYGNCLDFDGSNDYVQISPEIYQTTGITRLAWVKIDAYVSSYPIMGGNGPDRSVFSSYDYKWSLYAYDLSTPGYHSSTSNIVANQWTHVGYTYGDGTLKIFFNGVNETTVTGLTGNIGDIDYIGAYGGNYFNGKIDDVRIYDYALTSKQITEVMMGGRPAITETTSSPGVTMGYWKFDEGFGTTAYDASGRSNNLTHSAEAYTMAGKFGKAWDGDGTKYLSIGDNPDFDFAGTDDFSISGWFKHSPISTANDYIIAKHDSGGGYKIYMDSDGDIAFAIDDDGTWGPEDVIGNDQSRNYDDNSWHYFAAVKQGTSSIRLYVDGREIDNDTSLDASGTLVNTDLLYVGIDSDAATGPFDGELDEIKIYRFALSPEEILLDYNKGKSVIMGAVGTELQGAADQKPAFGTSGSQLNTDHPLANGLVGLWLMNEGSGTSIADLSGNGNTGTFNGTAPAWTAGKFGQAVLLPGTDEYIDVDTVFDDLSATTAGTWSVWVRPVDATPIPETTIIAFGDTDANARLLLEINYQGRATMHVTNAAGGNMWSLYTDNKVFNDNTWTHVVLVQDGTSPVIYIDSVAVDQGFVTNTDITKWFSTTPNIDNGRIGCENLNGSGNVAFFNGTIDHAMIYNRALSAEEVAQLYAEPFAMLNLPTVPSFGQNRAYCPPGYVGLCDPPVGEYKFDEYTGSTAYDTSGNTNNGAISGASWKGSADCKYNSCLDFDGTDDVVTITQDSSINMTGKSGYTMSAWIYPHSDGENDVGEIIDKGTDTYLRIDTESDGLDVEASLDLVTADATLNIDDIIFPNAWYHIVMTYEDDSDDEITIYINGANQGSSTDGVGSLAASDTNNLLIGGDTNANFDGLIDDVKIFDYALSQEQVVWVYNKGKPVGQWKFDEGEGPITYNSTTNDGGKLPGLRLDTDHPLSNGLVGLWLMNEGSGNKVFDLSGDGNTGTFSGSVSWTSGKYGTALDFPGGNTDWVTLANDESLKITGPLTIIIHFKMDAIDNWNGLVSRSYLVGADDNGYILLFDDSTPQKLSFLTKLDNVTGVNLKSDLNFSTGLDYVVAVTWDGAIARMYINGVEQSTTDAFAGTIGISPYPLRFFAWSDTTGNTPDGISEYAMIYNRALNPSEITQLYAEPFAMISDTGASSIIGATWNSSGKYNSALDFDGDDDVVTVAVDSDIDLNNKTGYSVCGWINPDSDGQDNEGEWFSKGNSYIRVDTESGSTVEVSALFDLESGGSDASLNTTRTIPIGSWSHICTTWKDDDDDELTIYINGLNAGSSTNGSGAPADDSTFHLYIGGDSSNNFDGDIDEVTIYNYELTAEQVKIDYNQGAAIRFGD